jgi:hypothetical protein
VAKIITTTIAKYLNDMPSLSEISFKKKGIDVSPIEKDAQNIRLLPFPTEEKRVPIRATMKIKISLKSASYLIFLNLEDRNEKYSIRIGENTVKTYRYLSALLEKFDGVPSISKYDLVNP